MGLHSASSAINQSIIQQEVSLQVFRMFAWGDKLLLVMKGGTTINIISEIMELWFFYFREFDFHRDCQVVVSLLRNYTAGRLKNFHNFYLASEDDSFIRLWKRDLLAGQTVTNTEFPMTESRVSFECIGLLHYLCFVLCSSLLVFPSYHLKIPKPSYTTLRPNTKS